MKVSAKIDYACRALLELSIHWPNENPMHIDQIATSQKIPIKFLTQILIILKHIGYVKSTRGKKGGYLLAISPKEIKLSEVIQGFDKRAFSVLELTSDKQDDSYMDSVWRDIGKSLLAKCEKIDFEKIVDQKRSVDNTMMFQI